MITKEKINKAMKDVELKVDKGVDSSSKSLNKLLKSTKKFKSKQVLKKSNMTVHISDYKAPSVLGDENRFFKGTMDNEKRSMFFS